MTNARNIPPRVLNIIQAVAFGHGVSLCAVLGERRTQILVSARHEAMWRVRALQWRGMGRHGHPSYPQIGRWFNRDHSTVVYAVQAISERYFLAADDVPVDEAPKAIARGPVCETMAA